MREILFRGRTRHGKWLIGETLRRDKYSLQASIFDYNFISCEVEYKTVGQFIGLNDTNKKKIFEGDIVHAIDNYDGSEFVGVVIFDCGSFCIQDKSGIKHYRLMDYDMEIIGNIFDNPELMEV